MTTDEKENNTALINQFISAKRIEGCSDNTLKYYSNILTNLISSVQKNICYITTNDLRIYLSNYQNSHKTSKVTLDNIRRIMSSFFTWLEDEDYILKSPVRRIHKVKPHRSSKRHYPMKISNNLEINIHIQEILQLLIC